MLVGQQFGGHGGCAGFVGDDLSQFVHADIGDVTTGHLPLVVRFDDRCGREPQERSRVGEDLDDVGAAFDLLAPPFDRVVRPRSSANELWETR